MAIDAWDGPEIAVDLAELYVRAGEYDQAINQLDYVLDKPAFISVEILKIDPMWKSLRDHTRFQALLEKYK